ncbi:MAG: hypothetical protein JXP34_21335 [Planctomycetes bacterium]|nr:hypothetical protein [Planctomycetota bacterium]
MREGRRSIIAFGILAAASLARGADPEPIPANTWVLIHREDASGGKAFASLIAAENTGRLYLWGTGGEQPARNVYRRYELESFDPKAPAWTPAFPREREGVWTADQFSPFRIYGQSGPDGLKYDEGPRLQVVGGYHSTNRIRWWDFDGVVRPSPVHTFDMACWDSKRNRAIYFCDGFTFALDPVTNTWTDLKPANHPTTCRTVAWASMAYDPVEDVVVLFGGGLATNPSGGAPTWIYDCAKNIWRRPRLDVEPPLRCNGAFVRDPASGAMVFFGGYDQASALNDTWIFRPREGRWERRTPKVAPPPMYAPAGAAIPGGGILVCGNDARKVEIHHQSRSSAVKETWVYDVARNEWTPAGDDLTLEGYSWLAATGSERHGAVYLVAFGPERRTYVFRYDPAALAAVRREGAPPGTIAWKYPEQKRSLEEAPPPDRDAQAKVLADLPPNTFVDAAPPGMLISKTWSTAAIDTDRSEVIYIGGGHSGYSGNDVARYRIADNRWSLDFPPRFPPFLESTNAGIFAWSYGMIPFSQHTYLWYTYDPRSKTILYLARPSLFDGVEVQLREGGETFVYEAKTHGYMNWVYDPVRKKMHAPSLGRPFANPWHLALCGTPAGVYAMCEETLYLDAVDAETGAVAWELIDPSFPKPRREIRYNYEFQPLLHDARRNRLIQLKGDESRVDVYVRSLESGSAWRPLAVEGSASIGREAVLIERHDRILWLGDRKLLALDLAENRLAELDVAMPEGLYRTECAFVYDPRHDICVALIPKSFSGPMQTFLFRFEPKTAAYRRG